MFVPGGNTRLPPAGAVRGGGAVCGDGGRGVGKREAGSETTTLKDGGIELQNCGDL